MVPAALVLALVGMGVGYTGSGWFAAGPLGGVSGLVRGAVMAQAGAPAITDIRPRQALAGETVEIIGRGFGSVAGQVTFAVAPANRRAAATREWRDDRIVAEVPYNVIPGEVIVRTAAGRLSNGFGFGPPCYDRPEIHKIEPAVAMRCEIVKITGCGFGSFQYRQRLTFNDVDATGAVVGNWSDTELYVRVPGVAWARGPATSGPVVVTNAREVPSVGVDFTVLDDEPQWRTLPSIEVFGRDALGRRHGLDLGLELRVWRRPSDPEDGSTLIYLRWDAATSGEQPIRWLTEHEFEQEWFNHKLRGHILPDQRAVQLTYSQDGVKFQVGSSDVYCVTDGVVKMTLPLVEEGAEHWNVWAPRFVFSGSGADLRPMVESVSFERKCQREDAQGRKIEDGNTYILDRVDWSGDHAGQVLSYGRLVFEGQGSDPCREPRPTWKPYTDLAGRVAVELPEPRWDLQAVADATVLRTLTGLADWPYTRRPLPGLPVILQHTPPGASSAVELGRTVTDNDGMYRFWQVPITEGLRLGILTENRSADPAPFMVTHNRTDGQPVLDSRVIVRTLPFATTMQRPHRHDVRFDANTGQSNIPLGDLRDVAAIYAHTWEAWRAAGRLELPLELRGPQDTPLEIRAVSPAAGVYWWGPAMLGPQFGLQPAPGGRLEVNIERASSGVGTFDRPINREFHEFGHHVMADIFDNALPKYWVSNTVSNTNHAGALNPTTSDSWIEGFAEYFATVVSRQSKTTRRPELYPVGPQTVINLDHNYKARSHWGAAPYGSVEEFAVASLLWDLADSDNDDNDFTPLGVTQSLLDHWQIQLSNPLAGQHWPPTVYQDRIALGDRRLIHIIRDSAALSQRYGLRSPNAYPGYDHVWDVKHLYDLLRAVGIGNETYPDSPHGLNALDELFVAHGFFADTAPQNLVYDPGEDIGVTGNREYTVIGQAIPERLVRHSPPPPPYGHLAYSARDAQTGSPVTVDSFVVELIFAPPHQHLSYRYRAPAGDAGTLALVAPEPLYDARIRIAAYGDQYKSRDVFELTGDEYWRLAGLTRAGRIAMHEFVMERVPDTVWLPLAMRAAHPDRPRPVAQPPATPPTSSELSSDVVAEINAERARWGLLPLSVQGDLRRAAEWYAADMAASGEYRPDHVDRLGRSMSERLREFGYTPEGFPRWQVTENIARGQKGAIAVVAAWMDSPRHRDNILDPQACEIGAGHGLNERDPYRHYWVADFGCRGDVATDILPPPPVTTVPPAPATTVAPPATITPPGTMPPEPTHTPPWPLTETPPWPATNTPPWPATTTPPFPEPTATIHATPTPAIGLDPALGIQGRITFGGVPVPGIYLQLRQLLEETWSDVRMAQSWDDGLYAIAIAPDLPDGAAYHVWYRNDEQDDRRVGFWRGPALRDYRAGQARHGGDFDLIDVTLLQPAPDTTLGVPATFQWQRRTLAGNSYRWLLYDRDEERLWATGDLGDAGSFTLQRLPDGVVTGRDYFWLVRIYNGPESFGSSYYMRQVRFTSAAGP